MEETDDENWESFFDDAPEYFPDFQCDSDSDDCPPPFFDLPPPPRPPWLDPEDESCLESSEYESCENIVIIDSQAHLEETFHNLIIIAVCSAILVILLVFLIACIWRLRQRRDGGCPCKEPKADSNKQVMEMTETLREVREVYDNPNYSHIMIGGQPFFILPSGELSDHVPVPSNSDSVQVTPRKMTTGQHIYEGGSSTYRSTSDYDTDSSNFRPESDRASDSFPPIYEEIDNKPSTNGHSYHPRHVSPPSHPRHVSPPHSQLYQADHGLPKFPSPESQSKTLSQHWSPHTKNSLSPRRPGPMMTMAKPGPNNSMYYYSDTLKRKGISDNIEPMHRGDQESDSGISSSRSGQNTSSESTPRHLALLNTSAGAHRRHHGAGARSSGGQLARSQETFHQSPVHLAEPNRIETQIIVKNTNRREPIVKV